MGIRLKFDLENFQTFPLNMSYGMQIESWSLHTNGVRSAASTVAHIPTEQIIPRSYYFNMTTSESKIRLSELSESERKDLLRIRNGRIARLARQKRHEEEDRIGNLYKENESRMDRLEDIIDELTKRAQQ